MSDDFADPWEAAIEIPLNKVAVASFAVFAVVMTAGSIWLIVAASSLVLYVIGLIGGAFFGCFTIGAIARLWDSQPGLTIDSLGIVDRSSLVYAGRVYWNEMIAIEPIRMQGQELLAFVLRDHKAFCARFRGIARLGFAMNPWIMGGSFAVSARLLGIDTETLVALLTDGFARFQNTTLVDEGADREFGSAVDQANL